MPDARAVMTWCATLQRAAVCLLLCAGATEARAQPAADTAACEHAHDPGIALDQGWTRAQREAFWFTSQGSRIMTFSWFIALEQRDTSALFVNACFMERLGFIPVRGSRLPIGLARDENESGTASFVGLTCAACHTSRLNIAGKWAIVEGGPAMLDFPQFLDELIKSIDATLGDEAKFQRWIARVGDTRSPETLKKGLQATRDDLKARQTQNTPTSPYGYGRVDAFGHIFNRVFASATGATANARTPDAPVSFPFLWDTPRGMHERVQWNWSAPNEPRILMFPLPGDLFRNLGELLGVFGTYDLTKPTTCFFPGVVCYKTTSYQRAKLERLERLVRSLKSPLWPSHLPKPGGGDARILASGAQVYQKACARCHALISPNRSDGMRKAGDRLIPLTDSFEGLRPLLTDPAMTTSFNRRLFEEDLSTGNLRGRPNAVTSRQRFGEVAKGQEILDHVLAGVFLGRGRHDRLAPEEGPLGAPPPQPPPEPAPTRGYKARSLNGIWATAPYLHNGSVPNLRLLLEANRGDTPFLLGDDTFDPTNVGLVTTPATGGPLPPRRTLFDPRLDGNRNTGHLYGTDLSPQDKDALLEFLKTL